MMGDDFILEEELIADERAGEASWPATTILHQPISGLPGLREPISVSPDATLRAAIERMNEEHVGCVLVEEDGELQGIFTERDVLEKVCTENLDVDAHSVAEWMTADPETLTLEDPISFALNRMTVGGFRHIPLVDEEGQPTGIVAMRSICEYLVDLFPREVLNLPPRPGLSIAKTREGA